MSFTAGGRLRRKRRRRRRGVASNMAAPVTSQKPNKMTISNKEIYFQHSTNFKSLSLIQ